MKKFLLLLFLFGILLFAGCATAKKQEVKPAETSITQTTVLPVAVANKETIKFGAILSSSDLSMKEAVEMAVEEINGRGGVNNKTVELFLEETPCNQEKAAAAADKLINIDKVVAIIGPSCSDEIASVLPIANSNKITLISGSANSPDLANENTDYFFRIIPSSVHQANVAAEYARKKLGAGRAATFYRDDESGIALNKEFIATFKASGGEIATEESMGNAGVDIRTQVTRVKALNPDIVYLVCYPNECAPALNYFFDLRLNTHIISTVKAEDLSGLSASPEKAEGFLVLAASPNGNNFKNRFKEKYGHNSGEYSGYYYDAVMVLAEAANKAGTGGIRDYLYNIDYDGVTGKIEFDGNGDLAKAKYDLKRFENGKFVFIENFEG